MFSRVIDYMFFSLPTGRALCLILLLFGLSFPESAAMSEPLVVQLSKEEQAWLADHPEIRLAVDVDWAPFEFVDDEKRYRGMAADFIVLVEERLGIRFEIDKTRSWSEMVAAVKGRDLDAFSLVLETPQRREYVNFTKSYISFPMVIVTRDTEPFIDGMAALAHRPVGVVNGYATHDLLAANHPEIMLNTSLNLKEGLQALSNGETYAFVDNLATVSQVIRDLGLSNLKISGQTPYRFELSMAVRSDWPELVPILQKALDSISPDERDEIHNRWIRVKFEEEIDYRVIFIVVGVSAFVVLVLYVSNWRLRKEVSRRRSAEFALQASEQKYRAMFSSSNVGMALCEMDGTLVEVNEEFAQIIGRSIEDTHKLTYWDLTPREYEQQEAEQLDSLQETGRYGPYEKEYLHKDGRRIPVLLNGCLIHNADGSTQIWSVAHDITARKSMEDDAQRANRSKSAFLANMSHELRTPLNAIIGFSDAIRMGVFGPTQNEKVDQYITDINSAGQVLLGLVNSILDISRVEAGKETTHVEKVDAGSILSQSTDMVSVLAAQKHISFETSCPADVPTVEVDPQHLRQIIVNLVSNAIKFSREGGIVKCSIEHEDSGMVKITIRDQGIGIPRADLDRVFDAFERAGDPSNAKEAGTGLGLTLTKRLTELNRGEISIASEEHVGTTVTVKFAAA